MKILEGNEFIFRFMLINISSGVTGGMLNFIIPVYAISLNATSTEIGLIKGFTGLGDLLTALPAGYFVDYFGTRKMYLVSGVFGILIVMLLSLADTPHLVLLVMVFYGVARTIRNASLSTTFFKKMNVIGAGKAGWYMGSMNIGASFIGPILGGMAVVAMNFTGYFAFTSAFLFLPFLVILARTNHRNNSSVKTNNSDLIYALKNYKTLAKNKILMRTTIIQSVSTAFSLTFSTFITVLVIRDFGLSAGIAALLISLNGIATIFVIFFCGRLLSKGNNNLYLFSFTITVLALLLLGAAEDASLLAIASVALAIGSGLITIITYAQVGNIEGEKGKVASILSFGQSTGVIFGPILGGIIGDAFSVKAIFLAFIPLYGALTLYIFTNGKEPNYSN